VSLNAIVDADLAYRYGKVPTKKLSSEFISGRPKAPIATIVDQLLGGDCLLEALRAREKSIRLIGTRAAALSDDGHRDPTLFDLKVFSDAH
jgi:hypothetical protein